MLTREVAPTTKSPVRGLTAVRPVADPAEHFVGRNDEQRGLLARLDRGPVALAVTGPAGIGKTRLLAETLGLAGLTRLSGSSWAGSEQHHFLPWRQVASAAATLLDPFASTFGARFQECSPIFPSSTCADPSRIEVSEHLLAVSFGDYLRQLAGASDGPIAVVLENLQHADRASVELLGRLVDQGLPVSFVVAVQTTAGSARMEPHLRACLDRFETLRLGSLGTVAVDDLLSACAVPTHDRERAVRDTAGVPLLLQHWLTDAQQGDAALSVDREQGQWLPDLPANGVFTRDGSLWTIGLGDEQATLRHLKGMTAIAALLDADGRELHVGQLSAILDGHASAPAPPGGCDLHVEGVGEVVLDAQAMTEYRDRIGALQSEVDEARAFNDLARCSRAEDELAALLDHLGRATGLGGQSRRTNTSAERARVRVTKSIRSAVARILDVAPSVGRHLDASISTGSYCSYRPIAPSSVTWVRR